MIKQGFFIGDRDWYIMAYYNIDTHEDVEDACDVLLASGASTATVREAKQELTYPNTGLTFTNSKEHLSVVFISKATSYDEMFSTITHETKHLTEHISSYYGVNPKSEKSAYLQGEISKHMYKAVAMSICPKCNSMH